MNLRSVMIIFVAVFVLIEMMAISASITWHAYTHTKSNRAIQRVRAQALFEAYGEQIISELVLGHETAINALLERLSTEFGVQLSITSVEGREIASSKRELGKSISSNFDLIFNNRVYGRLIVLSPIESFSTSFRQGVFGFVVAQVAIFSVLFYFLYRWLGQNVIGPMETLVRSVKEGTLSSLELAENHATEMQEISVALKELWLVREREIENRALLRISRQVAHDIRSPITALNFLIQMPIDEFQDQHKLLLKSVATRISSIAAKLRGCAVENDIGCEENFNPYIALKELALEKSLSLSANDTARMFVEINSDVFHYRARGDAQEFKRVVSNLINNAKEAASENTVNIFLRAYCRTNDIVVEVADNGRGIPEDIIGQVFNHGFTYGKREGSGLGLAHAKETIESIGGSIKINSKVGVGTSVKISIPKMGEETVLSRILDINGSRDIVLIDDEERVLDNMENILRSRDFKGGIKKIIASGGELESLRDISENAVFLIDHNLGSDSEDGLSIIRKVRRCRNSAYLFTSDYDNAKVIHAARDVGVKVIPKLLASEIQVALT